MGHNIRSKPNLKAPPVGMLALGNDVAIKEFVRFYIVIKFLLLYGVFYCCAFLIDEFIAAR